MTNFLQETIKAIKESGHSHEDIIFIGSHESGYRCDWQQFIKIADFEYDEGFGAPKIASDLIFIFSDGQQLRRGEYDGAEEWDFYKLPNFSNPRKEINRLQVYEHQTGWKTLEDIHEEEDW